MNTTQYFKTNIDSPIGKLYLIATEKKLVQLDFYPIKNIQALPNKDLSIFKQTELELAEYFTGKRKKFSVPLAYHKGTDFQKSVWDIIKKIPYGKSISYQEEAEILGDKNKCRAVGSANGKNPIAIIIPCHRIVRKSGELGGFGGGLKIKRFLLELEQKN